jgi:S-adenosylmethionine:tRNA ribosyltransferase-isomerase
MKYTLSDFDYELPPDLIAQEPATPRDHSRLLVYDRATGSITDDYFYNLPLYLDPSTTLVMNNSRVEKARLLFGNTEVFVLRQFGNDTVEALVRPGRKFKLGRETALAGGITAETLSVDEDGTRRIRFNVDVADPRLDPFRYTPFPPYIRQNEELAARYQTVIARHDGSKAAPTAGLHFTEGLLRRIRESGITLAEVTLHVGLGTFAPVKTENVEEHRLHEESYFITETTAARLSSARHITAVGTTSARVLESAVRELRSGDSESGKRHFTASEGSTDIFIKPGYRFRGLDHLITNFHLPKSTLLMMIAALTGYDEMRRIYDHAIRERYRFYSFGDAMMARGDGGTEI